VHGHDKPGDYSTTFAPDVQAAAEVVQSTAMSEASLIKIEGFSAKTYGDVLRKARQEGVNALQLRHVIARGGAANVTHVFLGLPGGHEALNQHVGATMRSYTQHQKNEKKLKRQSVNTKAPSAAAGLHQGVMQVSSY